MNNQWKNALYSLLLLVAIVVVWKWRQKPKPMKIQGETMGTTYHITYFDSEKRDFKPAIDSLLVLVNQSINTYNPSSEASLFNKANNAFRFKLPYLLPPIRKAGEIFAASKGAFDPTVMPLVNLWGFGWKKIDKPDTSKIDSIRNFVGFEKIKFNSDSVWKLDPRVQLDFGGIGQGYGADVITDFLKSKGIKNMLVELGGEGMACGSNLESGQPWELGILDPESTREHTFFKAYVKLKDKSFTTSGNYFNYKIVDGKKFSHTIDPVTGYPAQRAILSASVFADDCTTADAWGTSFMVMGHEKAIGVLKNHPELEALLMYSDETGKIKTYATLGISSQINLVK